MKRILALLLCGVLLFGLCACGNKKTPASSSGSSEAVVSDSEGTTSGSSSETSDPSTDTNSASVSSAAGTASTDLPSQDATDLPENPSDQPESGLSGGDLPSENLPPDPEPEITPTVPSTPSTPPAPKPVDPLVPYEANKAAVDKVLAASKHHVALCDQINGRIIVCDLAAQDWSNDNAVVWEYLHYGTKKAIYVDGLKFRDSPYYGEKVMIYCYPDGFRIISYATKKVLREVNGESKVGVNIHSVELLDDGTVITASSNDSLVCVFAPGNSTTPCQTFSLYSAHGVLWDPTYNVVWGVGGNMLVSYTVDRSSGKPQLVKKKTYYSPQSGMHDLAADYGDPHRLLFTCSAGIMVFDKRTGNMSYSYSGGTVGKTISYAPGCGLYADGVFVFTSVVSGQTVYREWCTNQVQYYVPINKDQGCLIVRTMPSDAYYKLRIVDFDFQ